MSRYNLQLTPGQQIPRDLNVAVQMRPEVSAEVVTQTDTVVVEAPAVKKLLLTGRAQVGGAFGIAGSPTTAEFYIMTSVPITEDFQISITTSDDTIAEVGEPFPTLLGAGDYARYDFSVLIHKGGSFDLLVEAIGDDTWVSDQVGFHAISNALGRDNFADAEAIVAADTFGEAALRPVDNRAFTRETDEPVHGGVAGTRSIWWKITPDSAGLLDLTLSATFFDSNLTIYTGPSVDDLTYVNDAGALAGNPCSIVGQAVSGGTTYYICVAEQAESGGAESVTLAYQLDVPSS